MQTGTILIVDDNKSVLTSLELYWKGNLKE